MSTQGRREPRAVGSRGLGIVAVVLLFAVSCSSKTGKTEGSGDFATALRNGPSDQIDLVALLGGKEAPPFEAVTVNVPEDPVFSGMQKRYEAYEIADVLSTSSLFEEASQEGLRSEWGVTFVALDRFRVTLPVAAFLERRAFLAFREVGRSDRQDWGVIPARIEALTPGPFYLIWENQEGNEMTHPNPYQVAFLVIEPLGKTYADAYPRSDAFKEGFESYTSSCVWCHSVNYVGGRSQREFNVPKSYTAEISLQDFLRIMKGDDHSQGCSLAKAYSESFYRSVYEYLEHMAGYPICTTTEECQEKEPQ